MKNLNTKEFLAYMQNKNYLSVLAEASKYYEYTFRAESNKLNSQELIDNFYNSLLDYKHIWITFYAKNNNSLSVKYFNEQNKEFQRKIFYKTTIKKYNCVASINYETNESNIHIYRKDFHYKENNFYSFEECKKIIDNFVFL